MLPAAAVALVSALTGDWLTFLWMAVIIVMAGCLHLVAAASWQHGYWQARGDMWTSLNEARLRGLSPGEWVQAQVEKDMRDLS